MHCVSPLIILKNLEKDGIISAYSSYNASKSEEDYISFLRALYEADVQDNFAKFICDKILYDENAFSLSCANKKELSPFIKKAYISDLKYLKSLVDSTIGNEDLNTGFAPSLFTDNWANELTLNSLKTFYESYGYGDYIKYKAFDSDGESLIPIATTSDITLEDLKDYEKEKKTISDNIENFLRDLPYSNMLLYGERGTGKSSTVHAMLNKYYPLGLRIVEISKENMLSLAALKNKLSSIPLKFIVYIDDLSLSGGDERISSLKAVLEGSMQGHSDNVMIVATSNRRHIIDEKFSDREDSVHSSDSMQEELSLSDRFGISVLFTTTTKPQYLSIISQLAKDYNIKCESEKLNALAERWAILKGGRSPRRAKQFISLAYSCESKGKDIDF